MRCSTRVDGDFRVDRPVVELAARRQALASGEWTWLRQVHGADVVEVRTPGAEAGATADGAVTAVCGAVLAVQTADCAPVVLHNRGAVAVAHAGWRGLVGGILPAVVETLRGHGTGPVRATLGPVIRPAGYEFGENDLAEVVAIVGPAARATTATGAPALDMAAAVRSVLSGCGVDDLIDLGLDTAAPEFFSHRLRGDAQRQVTVVALEPASPTT